MPDRRIIRGATVLALDGRRVLRKSDVLIEDGMIAAIGGVDTAGALITEASGILMPGFVQAHLHLDQTLLDRHLVLDVDPLGARRQIDDWLAEMDEPALRVQAEAAFARGLRTGTVTFSDAGRRVGRTIAIEAAARIGVRLIACLDATGDANVASDLDILSAELGASEARGLVKLAVWGGDAERTPISKLTAGARCAVTKCVPFIVHLGTLPGDNGGVRRLERAGALSKHLVVCHASGASLSDPRSIEALARAQASVLVTPAFDLLMGAPSPPIEKLIAARVNLGFGSECGATRLGLNAFKELRLLYRWLLGRVPQAASNALEIAARGGAAALGLGSGTVAVGQPADLMLLDVEGDAADDHELVARRVIVQGEPSAIRTIWVNGQVAYADGRITKVDPPSDEEEESLRARIGFAARARAKKRGNGLRSVLEPIARRRRLRLGWHQGTLPFLPEDTAAPAPLERSTSLRPSLSSPGVRSASKTD